MVKYSYRNYLIIYINNKRYEIKNSNNNDPEINLLHFLREKMVLTGTKLGCGEGACGACTVMVTKYDIINNKININAVNACLAPLCAFDLCNITTIEGIKNCQTNELHPVQKKIAEFHGSQCGFCTPGIVMSMYSSLAFCHYHNKKIKYQIDGNLCRCTGYRPLLDAFKCFTLDNDSHMKKIKCTENCSNMNMDDMEDLHLKSINKDKGTFLHSCTLKKFQDNHLNIKNIDFPSSKIILDLINETKKCYDNNQNNIKICGPRVTWYSMSSFFQLLQLKRKLKENGKIIVGNTEIGIETRFKNLFYPNLINISHIPEIRNITYTTDLDGNSVLSIGSAVTLTELTEFLKNNKPLNGNYILDSICNMLQWFASTQIRNVACIGGNIVTASPISDLNPILCACNAVLEINSVSDDHIEIIETRFINACNFFLSYRKVDLKPNEVIKTIQIPVKKNQQWEYMFSFKQAKRREDDISIVTAGIRVILRHRTKSNEPNWIIEDISIVFGGMREKILKCQKAEKALIHMAWDMSSFDCNSNTIKVLLEEICLHENAPGGMTLFRQTLCISFLHKFYIKTTQNLEKDITKYNMRSEKKLPPAPSIDDNKRSGSDSYMYSDDDDHTTSGVQEYFTKTGGLNIKSNLNQNTTSKEDNDADNILQERKPVGDPLIHRSAYLQVSGEAKYTDDLLITSTIHRKGSETDFENEFNDSILHGCLVWSTVPHGRITSIDLKEALAMKEVVGYYDASSLLPKEKNSIGAVIKDEKVFYGSHKAINESLYNNNGKNNESDINITTGVGQVIGIIIATSHEKAYEATTKINIKYEKLLPEIISINDSIRYNSFYYTSNKNKYNVKHHYIESGNPASLFHDEFPFNSDVKNKKQKLGECDSDKNDNNMLSIKGDLFVGGQEHFYLETNTCIIIPKENQELLIYSSTQNLSKTQVLLAHVLNIPQHKIIVKTKRLGGGFGGKESRSVFLVCAAAVAAVRLQKPIKLTIDRDVDMSITGTRHPFYGTYKVVANKSTGVIHGLYLIMYSNGGYSLDLSESVMDRALFHCDNIYNIKNIFVLGKVCKTNTPSNTAFRGFGGPQGLLIAETYINHLSDVLKIPSDVIKINNIYNNNDRTHYGQLLDNFYIKNMWENAMIKFNYYQRKKEIDSFNKKNKYIKKGIDIIGTKFGINFTAKFMNQGGALIHIYVDGSVLVSHGGTEMGQGLHTKIIQIVARSFQIDPKLIHIDETSTDKISNSSPSAASMSTDLYGMAALNACEILLERLRPYYNGLNFKPEHTEWKSIVERAYFDRVNLSAQGFYIVPNEHCGYDWNMSPKENSKKSKVFNYFTTGIGCSEVEVDTLTGDCKLKRVDILMDVGFSINPAIDIGQIEGAFMQGYGLFTMEELIRADHYKDSQTKWIKQNGSLFTRGPGLYKIPSFDDVPSDFRIYLDKDGRNNYAVHSSKAIGEPPLFLGASAFFAIKYAIKSARNENDPNKSYFILDSPATSEKIRCACNDEIIKTLLNDKNENFRTYGSY